MFGTVCTTALIATLAWPPAPPRAPVDTGRPKLLVKEKAYFLHVLPSAQGPLPRGRLHLSPGIGRSLTVADGLVLLHTSTTTGEMRVLATGSTTVSDILVRNSGPEYFHSSIAGVAVDKERLYVLQWSERGGEAYHLLVFRPDSGVLSQSLKFKGDAVPKGQPKETAAAGPLRLHPDGVACFGTRFEFKGLKLRKQSAEKKP